MTIYHLCTPEQWHASHGKETYTAPSLETEGFIHASTAAQLSATANTYYAAEAELCVVHINSLLLAAPLRWELSASRGEEFPHIYGPLNREAIVFMGVVQPTSRGEWIINP